MRKVIVTIAPTGGSLQKDQNPHVPIDPAEIADDVLACVAAGAAAAALHARRADGLATCDPDVYRDINDRLRAASDVVLNNSSGGGVTGDMRADLGGGMAEIDWGQRLAAVEAGADVVTLDAVTAWITGPGGDVLMNTSPVRARELHRRILDEGIAPEWEVFNPAHLAKDIPELLGDAVGTPIVNICVGLDAAFTNATPYIPRLLELMRDMLPRRAAFTVSSGDAEPFPALAHAIVLGGHVRVGLEDHPFDSRGRPRTNVALVERAVRLVEDLGFEAATPAEARGILGLGGA